MGENHCKSDLLTATDFLHFPKPSEKPCKLLQREIGSAKAMRLLKRWMHSWCFTVNSPV